MPQFVDALAGVFARRTFAAVLVAGAVFCAAALAGCSSNGSSASTASPPSAGTRAASGTPAPAQSPAPAVTPTPIDPSTIPLQTDAGAAQAYVIKLPADWQAENIPAPGGFGRRYTFYNQAGTRTAQITVKCQSGATIDSLQKSDNAIVGSLKGTYGAGGIKDVTLGGMQGNQTGYTLAVGGTQQETHVIYLQGKICGWQILEQTFAPGDLVRYQPLFDAIMATFAPTTAGG